MKKLLLQHKLLCNETDTQLEHLDTNNLAYFLPKLIHRPLET